MDSLHNITIRSRRNVASAAVPMINSLFFEKTGGSIVR
jgi:hypothetical protein